ncbi:MAG: nuclear transport factor 2 family protein [Hyphomonadaceae bacterium]
MRALLIGLALVVVACSSGQGVAPAVENYGALKDARAKAYERRDRAFFEKLLANDFRGMNPTGTVLDKAGYLDLEFGPGRAGSITSKTEVSDFEARRTGDTLVMTYSERVVNHVGAQVLAERSRRLDVYAMRNGQWRLVAMTGARLPEAPTVIAMAAEQLAAFAGEYEFAPGVVSRVWVDGNHLAEQSTGQPQTKMMPMGPDLFFDPGNLAARISFSRDAAGRVDVQIYQSDGQSLRGKRVGG